MPDHLFHFINNLEAELTLAGSNASTKVIHQDDSCKTVLFRFAPGQGLREHEAKTPGILYFVKGDATVTLGDRSVEAKAGAWIHMSPELLHSISAQTETLMLLLLLTCASTSVAPAEANAAL